MLSMGGAKRVEAIVFIAIISLLACAVLAIGALAALGHPVAAKPELLVPEVIVPSESTTPLARMFDNGMERIRVGIMDFSRANIPGYDGLLEANTKANLAMNRALFDAAFDGNYAFLPLAKISEGDVFVHKDEGHLFLGEPDTPKAPEAMAALINDLQARHPDLNMYVYLVPPLWITDALRAEDPVLDMQDVPMEQSLDALNPAIPHGSLSLPDYKTFAQYYFKTDHHWNMDGAYQGYLDIVELLRTRHPDIQPLAMHPDRAQVVTGVRGSLATVTAYDASTDTVSDGGFDLPAHELIITAPSGKLMPFDSVAATRAKAFPERKYWDAYEAFFTPTRLPAVFKFPENRTGRRLLLMSDSLRKCIMEPIASHFDETFTVDVRYEESFRFDAYVKEHGITDVLFLYGDTYNNIPGLYADHFE